MISALYSNLKLRLWHFLFLPTNVANIENGKTQLSRIVDHLSGKKDYYLVYQYGKAGSSTVHDFFNRSGLTSIHCHHLNDKTLELRESLAVDESMPLKAAGQRFFSNARYRIYQRFLLKKDINLKIFISLREPEGFLQSVYFQHWNIFSELIKTQYKILNIENFTRFFNESLTNIDKTLSDDAQQDEIEKLLFSGHLDLGTRCILHFIYGYVFWFELELFETFGISSEDFAFQQNYWSFNKNNIKGSIIKIEDFNDSLNDSLKSLLEKDINIPIVNKNVGNDKLHSEYYEHLKRNVDFPSSITKLMKSGFSYRYFYH